MEHTSGDDLARMQVTEDRLLEVAKSDLSDHFHRCEALAALRAYFGLKGNNLLRLKAMYRPSDPK